MAAAPAPPGVPSAPTTCPLCHAPLAPGTRFCGQCGAPVSAGPSSVPAAPSPGSSPPPPPPPVDLRQKVEGDRGTLKRLQLLIPGFRGYRQGEDLRDADSILRREVADKLVDALALLGRLRQDLVSANQYGSLNDVALVISDLTVLEGRIRHAEQGYSGISATIRVGPQDLDRLYEYDYGFVLAADQLRNALGPLQAAAAARDGGRIATEVANVRALIAPLRSAFESRMATIEGIRV
jgi:hypothetical protein